MFYINLVRNFQEFEHSLQPNEKYRVSYAKQAVRKVIIHRSIKVCIFKRMVYFVLFICTLVRSTSDT